MRFPVVLLFLVAGTTVTQGAVLGVEFSEVVPPLGLGTVRWSTQEPRVEPRVGLDGQGQNLVLNWQLNNPRVEKRGFDGLLLWSATTLPKVSDNALAVSRNGAGVAALYANVFSGSDLYLSVWLNGSAPAWTQVLGKSGLETSSEDPLSISADGQWVVAAFRDRQTGEKIVTMFETFTGRNVFRVSLPSATNWIMRGVHLSANGERIAVGVGNGAFVLDRTGALLAEFYNGSCCDAPSLSDDGRRLLLMLFDGRLQLLDWDGAKYVPTWTSQDTRWRKATLSSDGSVVAVYESDLVWLGAYTCGNNRVSIFRPPGTFPYSTYSNYADWACIEALLFSHDGNRLIVGTWGTRDTTEQPQDVLTDVVTVLDTRTPFAALPVLRFLDDIHGKGSTTDVAISDDGKRVAVGILDHQTQVFGWGGATVQTIELLT